MLQKKIQVNLVSVVLKSVYNISIASHWLLKSKQNSAPVLKFEDQ